jgi:NADPH-dependent 7-cyano-7-deazaguanine reductase QueF
VCRTATHAGSWFVDDKREHDGMNDPSSDPTVGATRPMLGRLVEPAEYGRLDVFPVDKPVRVTFVTDELQALCPAVEGLQPDIYRAEFRYTAVTHAIESKSFKLCLVTYRERRVFAEHLVIELHDVIAALAPRVRDIEITLRQNVRGGITTEVSYPA